MHSYNDEEILSPIPLNRSGTASPQTRSPVEARRTFLTSSDLEDTDDSEEEQNSTPISHKNSSASRSYSHDGVHYIGRQAYVPECNIPDGSFVDDELKESSRISSIMSEHKLVIFVILVVAAIFAVISSENLITNPVTIDSLKTEFPMQDQDFWIALETGLQEVVRFEKPSVFLFLYKEDDESTTDKMLLNIAMYASCVLNSNCDGKPIVLSSEELSNNEILREDGGHLLKTYKSDLEAVHVMIVKNLENVPGYAAKVLHSFCDEISPAVRKSVFFLTLKVPEFPKKEMRYVRSLLKEKWHDIKEDHFEPLFARISGMILSLKS